MLQMSGYMAATRDTGSPRDIEYQLFCRITGAISKAIEEPLEFPSLVKALNDNLALWQEIAMDLIDEENRHPVELKSKIFYLYEFTQIHTKKILRGEANADVLIDINKSMINGLRQSKNQKDAI